MSDNQNFLTVNLILVKEIEQVLVEVPASLEQIVEVFTIMSILKRVYLMCFEHGDSWVFFNDLGQSLCLLFVSHYCEWPVVTFEPLVAIDYLNARFLAHFPDIR